MQGCEFQCITTGSSCPSPDYGPRASLVFHTNGLHPVTVLFCHCDNAAHAGDRVQQLLRAGLYPATTSDPTTFFTFQCLEQFHMLTLQGKLTAYDYYLTLVRLTDNTGLATRYVSLLLGSVGNVELISKPRTA